MDESFTVGMKKIELHIGQIAPGATVVIGDHNTVQKPGVYRPAEPAAPGALPDGSRLPYLRNALFTGRASLLGTLETGLLGEAAPPHVLSGLGGVGKTQLAVEFAYRAGHRFQGVHWLNLSNPLLLETEIAACGTAMGLSCEKQPEQVAETLRIWQAHGPRLLILDGLESSADAGELLARLQFPAARLLITSRRADFSPTLGWQLLPLSGFSPAESRQFLRCRAPYDLSYAADFGKLSEFLGHLPLALELASSYLNVIQLTPGEYLEELEDALTHESMQAAWFREMEITNPTRHEQGVWATFHLSWAQVQGESAQKTFKLAGYLAPSHPIPPEILLTCFESPPPLPTPGKKSKPPKVDPAERTLRRNLHRLGDLNLLQFADGEHTIHPLVAQFARSLNEDPALPAQLAAGLGGLSRTALATGLPERFLPLHEHLATLVQYVQGEIAAYLWSSLGQYHFLMAGFAAARHAFEQALSIDEALRGPNHPEVATDLNNLGCVLLDLGQPDQARNALERAFDIDKAALGASHPNLAIRASNLGGVLFRQGDFDAARKAFIHAFQIDEAVLGSEHPRLAADLQNLGSALVELGEYPAASAALERALTIDIQSLGEEHPAVASDLAGLGDLLREMGDFVAAQDALKRALQINEKHFGPEHPRVAADLNSLGLVYKATGDFDAARNAFERALAIDEKFFSPDHPTLAVRIHNLGSALQDLGDLPAARSAFERAIQVWVRAHGQSHPDVASGLNSLGLVFLAQGQPALARAAFERALDIDERWLGAEHPKIGIRTWNLGNAFRAEGDTARARACYQAAWQVFSQHYPSDHPNLLAVQAGLAELGE